MANSANRLTKVLAGITLIAALLPGLAFAARTSIDWVNFSGTSYIQPNYPNGMDLLIYGANHYINFNAVTGSSGYGIRDNAGTMEFKNSGGSWAGIGSGGSSSAVDPFNHPGTNQSATSSLMLFYGNATSSGFEATSSVYFSGLAASSLLALDNNKKLIATSSIGTNLLKGPVSSILAFDSSGLAISTTSIGVNYLSANTISGVTLGNNLASHSHGSTLTGTSYNGSGAVSDWDIDLTHANTWTGKQVFGNSTSTMLSAYTAYFGANATSSFDINGLFHGNASTTALTASNFWDAGLTSALALFDSNHKETAYAGSAPCTNQVALSLSATGVITCTSVSNAMLSNSTISGVALGGTLLALSHGTTLTGTSYTGTSAVSDWDIDLTHPNTWTGKQIFGNSTSTMLSAYTAYFGGNATSSFDINGLYHGNASTTALTTSNFWDSSLTSALALFDSNHKETAYAGSSNPCTSQVPTTISAAGTLGGCTSVADAWITGQIGLAHGGTNASLSGANQVPYINSGNSAFTNDSLFSRLVTQGLLLLGTSTASYIPLTVGSSTQPQLALSDNVPADNMWTFRDAGGILYVATSTATGTSTTAALSLDVNGFLTLPAIKSALILTDANGKTSAYAGFSNPCTNQVFTTMSAVGAGGGCTSIADSWITGQIGLAHGGTNASLSGASQIVAMNSGNTALTTNTGYTLTSSLLTAPNASTTALTVGSFFTIPNSASQAPTIVGALGLDTTDNQLCVGLGGTTGCFDKRVRLTISYATTTTWTGNASSTVFVIPQGTTWNTIQCTVQPNGATLTAQYFYANPTPYTNVYSIQVPASTTPGIYTLSSNNTPATQATSTLGFSSPAGTPVSGSCTLTGVATAT